MSITYPPEMLPKPDEMQEASIFAEIDGVLMEYRTELGRWIAVKRELSVNTLSAEKEMKP